MNYVPTERGPREYIENRNSLIDKVQANLTVFETEVTELERLWVIHDKHRTTDPATFEIGVSIWRPRRQSLQDRLRTYWSAEDSLGHQWVTLYEKEKEKGKAKPDRAISTALLAFQTQYDSLIARCEEVGFLDFLQVAFLSPAV